MSFQAGLPSDVDAPRVGSVRRVYQPLVTVVAAAAAGIALDGIGVVQLVGGGEDTLPLENGFLVWWCLAVCCLIAWLVARNWYLARNRWHAVASVGLLIGAVLCTGGAWHHLRWHVYSSDEVGRYATYDAEPTCLRATVSAVPETLPAPARTPLRAIPGLERTGVTLVVDAIRDGTEWRPAAGHCQLAVDGHLLGIRAGDRVQVFAQLRRPAPPLNPGQFDFAARARTDRRLAMLRTVSPDCVGRLEAGGGWATRGLQRLADRIRARGQRLLRQHIGGERADVAAAMLLGARAGLSADEIEPFFLTGTIHLLVVSGLHVGILAMGLFAALRIGWLSRRMALASTMAVVIGFALVTGGEPPVVRAAALVVLVCVAAWIGRRGVAFNSLAAAAVVVLAINPAELFQVGTQLSFLAVATLIAVGNRWEARRRRRENRLEQLIAASRPWYVKATGKFGRWNAWLLATTAVVWLTALPLVLYRFHVVTPIALAISPLVWIFVLFALWAGFLLLAIGWLFAPAAAFLGWACDHALGGLEGVVDWADAVPAGHFWAPGPALWWVLGFYAGLLAVMVWGWPGVRTRWLVALVAGWIVVGVAPPLARAAMRDDALRCSFLAMGHGESILLELPGGQTLLYDAGSLGSPEYATQTIAGFLWERGILRLDGIVLSHADVDHYNAVPGLLDRFRVAAVYVSPQMFARFGISGPRDGPSELRRAVDAAGVPVREIWSGDRLRLGGDVAIDVLHPPREGLVASDNANSVVLAVEYAGRRILLPGDLESPGLEDVMAERPYDCDVLLAPHHGSRRSDPPGFAAWCTPEVVVISGGSDADPLVRRTYEGAGARVFNTGDDGAVELSVDRANIHVDVYRRTRAANLH
jgi:competence protein ComEC